MPLQGLNGRNNLFTVLYIHFLITFLLFGCCLVPNVLLTLKASLKRAFPFVLSDYESPYEANTMKTLENQL